MSLIGVILSGIFMLLSHFIDFLISPIISGVLGMFPTLQPAFYNVMQFLSSGFTYLTTILRWLLFTPAMWVMLFDYFLIKYSVWVIAAGIRLAIKMYHYLKPT